MLTCSGCDRYSLVRRPRRDDARRERQPPWASCLVGKHPMTGCFPTDIPYPSILAPGGLRRDQVVARGIRGQLPEVPPARFTTAAPTLHPRLRLRLPM